MKRQRLTPKTEAGFTIVELMIATLVFSVILTVITAGVLHFTTDYYRGINSSTTQAVAANVLNDITQAIKFSKPSEVSADSDSGGGFICAGGKNFVYFIGNLEPSTPSGVLVFNYDGAHCYANDTSYPNNTVYTDGSNTAYANHNYQDMLQDHLRLTRLDLSDRYGPNKDVRDVNVGVAYGDYDLFCDSTQNGNATGCLPGDAPFVSEGALYNGLTTNTIDPSNLHCKSQSGSQYCDVVNLSTTVQSRVTD